MHQLAYNRHMEKEHISIFAHNLKNLIGEQSVYEFAKKVGINHQTLFRYLHCQRVVSLGNLIKIADYFHEDLDFLVGRKDY